MNDDVWTIIILLFTVLGGDEFINLLQSDNFDAEYENLIHTVENLEADVLKEKLIKLLEESKQKAKCINQRYNALQGRKDETQN